MLKKLINSHYKTSSVSRFSSVRLSAEIKDAIAGGRPVVALESTIISHGMPYPRNLEVAKEVEEMVRNSGAVPATIAIIDGIPKVGLSEADMVKLANHNGSVIKASTRDISFACARKVSAATTVASTMRLAHLAGISVFATGGIGGAHRGAEVSMDISADLLELSRTPVTVVCAGIKSILDIPRSLEVLETFSVPVVSYNTNVFPAFYTNESGIPSPLSSSSCHEIASMMMYQRSLNINSGLLLAVPNPEPANAAKIQYAIDFALLSAKNEGVIGAAVTPYVLAKVQQLTSGESLDSNIALVMNNAKIAAVVAAEYAALQLVMQPISACTAHTAAFSSKAVDTVHHHQPMQFLQQHPDKKHTLAHDNIVTNDFVSKKQANSISTHSSADSSSNKYATTATSASSSLRSDVIVVGGAVLDLIGHVTAPITRYQTSNPGRLSISHGGVGRNIAQNLAALGATVSLATAVGDDVNGHSLLSHGESVGIDMSKVRIMRNYSDNAKNEEDAFIGNNSKNTKSNSGVNVMYSSTQKSESRHSTAVYNAVHDSSGDLCIGLADMSILNEIDPVYIKSLAAASVLNHSDNDSSNNRVGDVNKSTISQSKIVVADGNLSIEAFATLSHICKHASVPLFFEPTSDHKCLLPLYSGCLDKVDIIKPNITELIHMVSYCMNAGLVNIGKSLVANTLSNIVANRIDSCSLDEIDITDVRILTNALYQAISVTSPLIASPADPSLQAFLSKQQQLQQSSSSKGVTSFKAVSGKHVIVSLGSRGVMWCGPLGHVHSTTGTKVNYIEWNNGYKSNANDSKDFSSNTDDYSVVDDESLQSATCYLKALHIDPTIMKPHTNGAGDALCAGIISECINKANKANADRKVVLLPDLECIRKGLLNAHHWLVTK